MTVSWRDYDGLPEDPWDSPYEANLRAAERERMAQGVQPLVGYRRPHEPTCPKCQYVLVDNVCVGCPERAARLAASLERVGEAEGLAELAEPTLDEAA